MESTNVLHYVALPTRVGRVVVLMSGCGVVDVVFDGPAATPSDPFRVIASRFPRTRLLPGDGAQRVWAAAVVEHIDGTRPRLEAPVDLRWSTRPAPGTAPSPTHLDRVS